MKSPHSKPRRRRCAIYTRKSTEEGLEQDLNTLDAQREACEAYILSQIHEGWEVLPTYYDDGKSWRLSCAPKGLGEVKRSSRPATSL